MKRCEGDTVSVIHVVVISLQGSRLLGGDFALQRWWSEIVRSIRTVQEAIIQPACAEH